VTLVTLAIAGHPLEVRQEKEQTPFCLPRGDNQNEDERLICGGNEFSAKRFNS